MYRINCHSHTVNSDGANTLQEMAKAAKALGHSAYVVTDHDSSRKAGFQCNCAELRVLKENNLIDFPVIIGSEIMTPFGEYLLFGNKANKNWMTYHEMLDVTRKTWGISMWVEFFKRFVIRDAQPYTYGLIMCHPRFTGTHFRFGVPDQWWPLVHGFEIQNYAEEYEISQPEVAAELRKTMPNAVELRNSDAHTVNCLGYICNETKSEITDESQLIAWFTNTRLGKERS